MVVPRALRESAFSFCAARGRFGGPAVDYVRVVACVVDPQPELVLDGFWRQWDNFVLGSLYWTEISGILRGFARCGAEVVAFGPEQAALISELLGPSFAVVEAPGSECPWTAIDGGFDYDPRRLRLSVWRDEIKGRGRC